MFFVQHLVLFFTVWKKRRKLSIKTLSEMFMVLVKIMFCAMWLYSIGSGCHVNLHNAVEDPVMCFRINKKHKAESKHVLPLTLHVCA